jgi:DNA-directed RNA polymerase specialized sigma24 family protein
VATGGVIDVEAYLRRAVVNAVKNTWRRRTVGRRVDRLVTQALFDSDPRALDTIVVERDELLTALNALPPVSGSAWCSVTTPISRRPRPPRCWALRSGP